MRRHRAATGRASHPAGPNRRSGSRLSYQEFFRVLAWLDPRIEKEFQIPCQAVYSGESTGGSNELEDFQKGGQKKRAFEVGNDVD